MMPRSRAFDIVIRGLNELQTGCSPHPRRHIPLPSVLVASAIAKGTFRIRASVCASSVLPEPVGPSIRMLRLLQLNAVVSHIAGDALVVIVDRDGKRLLRRFLADDIIVQHRFDLRRFGDLAPLPAFSRTARTPRREYRGKARCTRRRYTCAGARHKAAHIVLAFAAERALHTAAIVVIVRHIILLPYGKFIVWPPRSCRRCRRKALRPRSCNGRVRRRAGSSRDL